MSAAPPRGSVREVFADRAVRVSVGVTVVVMLGFGLIVPILPLYARSFDVGSTEVGLLSTVFALTRLVFDLVAGPLADRYGERRMATLGTAIVGVSSVLMAIAPSFGYLLVFRAIGGAGSAILFAALLSYLLHSVPPERMARATGIFFAAFLTGTMLGQPLGGLIAEAFGLASPLWGYAAACFISAALTWRFLGNEARASHQHPPAETAHEVLAESEGPPGTTWSRVRELLSGRAFVGALVANAVLFWVLGSVRLTLVPLFARDRVGLSEAGIGLVLGAAAVGQFAVMWRAGALADSRGRKRVLVPGLAGMAVAVGLLGWASSTLLLVLVLGGVGLATGFAGVAPAAMVADVAPRAVSGTAVGMYRFAGDLGLVAGPVLTGFVADSAGYEAAFLVAAAAPLVACLLVVLRVPETLGTRRPVAA